MELHRKFRDQIAPLESSLAALFRKRGLEVRGAHGITGIADPDLVAEVERVFEAEFVEGAPWASLSI